MSADSSRNITFHLPADLIRQAKVYAAQRDTTITALVRNFLERTVTAESLERSRAAGLRFIEIAKRGPHFTGDPRSIKREDLYDRNWDRFFPQSDQSK